jgi:hypothetical protein
MMVETIQYWRTPPLPILACGVPSASEPFYIPRGSQKLRCKVPRRGSRPGIGPRDRRAAAAVREAAFRHRTFPFGEQGTSHPQCSRHLCADFGSPENAVRLRKAAPRAPAPPPKAPYARIGVCPVLHGIFNNGRGIRGCARYSTLAYSRRVAYTSARCDWLEQCFAALALLPAALLLNRALC